ncbi:hypothetical protein HJC99_03275 [Candidatus Saccharibacteria bacterium]|nr:hypothetical protein [Candidatus Saccharibacteria bacterium]
MALGSDLDQPGNAPELRGDHREQVNDTARVVEHGKTDGLGSAVQGVADDGEPQQAAAVRLFVRDLQQELPVTNAIKAKPEEGDLLNVAPSASMKVGRPSRAPHFSASDRRLSMS